MMKRSLFVLMGITFLLGAGGASAEILLSPGDIGPSSPAVMTHDRVGLLMTRPEAHVYSGGAIPLPAELDGADVVRVTVYFIPDSPEYGLVNFKVLVDAYNVGDQYNYGAYGATPAPVPVGGTENIVYSQTFDIDWVQLGNDIFRVAIGREFYGADPDTYPTGVYVHAIAIERLGDSAVGEDEYAPDLRSSLDVRPNPFATETTIRYRLRVSADVSVLIFDASGRLVTEHCPGQQSPGDYSFTWEASEQPQGVYFVRLLLDGAESNSKAVKLE